jgi:hypothetical protein
MYFQCVCGVFQSISIIFECTCSIIQCIANIFKVYSWYISMYLQGVAMYL